MCMKMETKSDVLGSFVLFMFFLLLLTTSQAELREKRGTAHDVYAWYTCSCLLVLAILYNCVLLT